VHSITGRNRIGDMVQVVESLESGRKKKKKSNRKKKTDLG
jgi:hypothetical protein